MSISHDFTVRRGPTLRRSLALFVLTGLILTLIAAPAFAAPDPDSVSPQQASNSGVAHLTITGTGFVAGPPSSAVKLIRAGQEDIPGVGTVVASSTSMSANFNLAGAQPGLWTVRVTNPDDTTGDCACFTVLGGQPSVANVNPASRGQGAVDQDITINGSNFAHGATASFGAGITVE